jgi:hypothetical protein
MMKIALAVVGARQIRAKQREITPPWAPRVAACPIGAVGRVRLPPRESPYRAEAPIQWCNGSKTIVAAP